MNHKKKIVLVLIFAGLISCFYLYLNLINGKNIKEAITFKETKPEILIADFKENEAKADLLYTGKVIEITGTVKEVSFLNNRNTLILQGKNKDSGIICDMNNNQIIAIKDITIGETLTIKGICKGFLKDVVMLNCIIITTN